MSATTPLSGASEPGSASYASNATSPTNPSPSTPACTRTIYRRSSGARPTRRSRAGRASEGSSRHRRRDRRIAIRILPIPRCITSYGRRCLSTHSADHTNQRTFVASAGAHRPIRQQADVRQPRYPPRADHEQHNGSRPDHLLSDVQQRRCCLSVVRCTPTPVAKNHGRRVS